VFGGLSEMVLSFSRASTPAINSSSACEVDVVAAIERLQQDPDERLRRRARKLLAHYRRGGRINAL
jgi:hypothetical protein